MRYVDLPEGSAGPAPAKVSVLGFGCAALMGRAGRTESLAALGAAWDAGITFFDTARSYGYGESESLLGEFLTGRRTQAVVCTKFGILPGAKGGWKQKIKPLAQSAIRVFPALRQYARRAAASEIHEGHFTPAVLTSSFEASLRELRTDYVDMLLLHAAPLTVLDQDDLLGAVGRLVEAGKVRMAGISGEQPVIEAAIARPELPFTTAQFALNRTHLAFTGQTSQPAARRLLLVANHPFGGPAGVAATLARITAMRTSQTLPASLREKLSGEPATLMPEVLLNVILSGTGVSAVVPAMMRVSSLKANVRAIEHCRFTPEELDLLRTELIRQP